MKSFKNVFRSKKKKAEKITGATEDASDITPNGDAKSIGLHSNASTLSRTTPLEDTSMPPVPPLPEGINSSTSIVDLTDYAQPKSTVQRTSIAEGSINDVGAATPSEGRSPIPTPANPQLVSADSPLISSQIAHNLEPSEDADNRPTEHEPRSPHTTAEGVPDALHRSGTLPPAYNSLHIPPTLASHTANMATASAPSPVDERMSPLTNSTIADTSSVATPSIGYVAPPPPSPQIPHIEQPHSYPIPLPDTTWPAQQPYSTSSSSSVQAAASGSQQYGHRPFIAPGNENQTYPIIMAIDWGTTYSSMAYAYQQDGEVHEVSTWPKQTHNYPKVPTCNLYGPNSKEILEWGYTAKTAITKPPYKNHVLLSKYKLHLDDAAGPHPPLPNGLTVVDAIADYLRLFHAHVIQTVLKGFGSSFEQQHIQYCLSVPAMWTDNAKAIMRQAALRAGMISPLDPPHRLLLISEPEAAALYCEKKCDQFQIGHGQRFMICDAGGGTVDLIVFEVAVGPHGRTLREVTRGSGHSCGSIFLDERMEALLRKRFAKWQEKGLTAANWVQLMETFIHNVKPLFDGVEDQYITMPAVPGRADLTDFDIGLEDGILTVSAEEMRREVFDPVINDVLRLIQHQLQQTHYNCHAIFLVGGFGCSGYLHTRVQAEFGARVPMIGVPPRAELAVVRGAAYAGLMPRTITQRVARRWYGVDSLMAYEEGSDLPHKRVRDHEGMMRARDRFSVYVAPGQHIGIDECITKRYVTYQYPKPVNSPLFACSSMNLPRYVDSPMVEKIGDFLIPLPYVHGAQPGHKMVFELRMYFGATEIRAEAEVNGIVVTTRCQFTG
ncbi:hypothetical protein EC957_002117 [Mortierella hygrophila]|uniref:Actin-like ATPase domain-containing protein n=1 Tax=Mortierella hygrophila TaxID=979708 RepID=A0A9P6F4W1_9FUNG|nr:hypothetical protein EC957_002117 [Mortierella hygrophila]